jgi:hypothetical protein
VPDSRLVGLLVEPGWLLIGAGAALRLVGPDEWLSGGMVGGCRSGLDGRARGAILGPVAKFFRAEFARELRSAEPAIMQSKVETRSSEILTNNQKLGRAVFSRSSHTGREKFATGPLAAGIEADDRRLAPPRRYRSVRRALACQPRA